MRQMVQSGIATLKNVLTNLVAIGMAVAAIYAATLPDISPFSSAEYTAVKFNNQLLLEVDIPKQTAYSAEVTLYTGSGYIGSLTVPSGGQRVVEATFSLPPSAVGKSELTITAYWRIHSWNDIISPTELYIRVPVTIPGG